MTKKKLQNLIEQGEDSHLQFKEDVKNLDSLAAEIVAFSNSDGGRLLIGVSNDGQPLGLLRQDVDRINQLISNAASQHIPIEIISPGHLPNNLTVEKIKAGNSNIRNSTIVTYIAKGLLPYRGIGTGIRRAYDDWDQIDLHDDRDACTFTVTVQRPVIPEGLEVTSLEGGPMGGQKGGQKLLTKRQSQLYDLLKQDPNLTRAQLAQSMGINSSAIQKHIEALKQKGVIKRIGGAKGGHWEVIDEG